MVSEKSRRRPQGCELLKACFRSKVDRFVPRIQHGNLKMVGEAYGDDANVDKWLQKIRADEFQVMSLLFFGDWMGGCPGSFSFES